MDILELLVQKGLVLKEDVDSIIKDSVSSGISVEDVLVKRGGVSANDILKAKSDYYGVPIKVLGDEEIPDEVLGNIPEDSASHYSFVPLSVKDGVLEVGMTNPDDIEANDALNFISSKIKMPLKIFLISQSDFDRVFSLYKGLSGEVSKSLSDLESDLKAEITSAEQRTKAESEGETEEDQIDEKEDAPVTKMVATILRYATDGNASDIHIEPWRESLKVRFRVDGVMNTSLILPSKVHSAIVSRVKILSNIRLDEKRKPQDGRFSAKIDKHKIDFRVSTFPTYYGEKVVMRILDQEKGIKNLTDIGLSQRNLDLIQTALKKPYGLILISGPTGSGKTTTLYAMLNELDREHQNVLSLEDPIEYNIEGISQSQVHPEIGYTFASGLRTTLRQDPDVIMVGEIRDKETAQLAIQAALTGHVVLSTIHTNSAAGVIPRLIDMGVDPYLIAPTLSLAMAQRLTMQLCPDSGEPVPIEGSFKQMIDKQFADLPQKYLDELDLKTEMYKVSATSDCPNGTRGRVAVIEVFDMDKDMEAVILKSPTEAEVYKLARAKGMLSMKEDAILKAMHRIVPFEEVNNL